MNAPISVAIADDHALFREGVRVLLEREQDIEVRAEAGNGTEAVELVAAVGPDVVLLDVSILGDGGSMTVRRMKQISPRTMVIILSMYDESALVRCLIEEGIGAYLLKSVTSAELLAAIRSVRSGGRLTLAVSARSMWDPRDDDLLSRREREILELAALALSNSQIAGALGRRGHGQTASAQRVPQAWRGLKDRRGKQGQGGLDDLHGRGPGRGRRGRRSGPQRLPHVPTAGLAA